MTCVTRAREIPSGPAISARDATLRARASRAAGPRGPLDAFAACSCFLARAKSNKRHVAKGGTDSIHSEK